MFDLMTDIIAPVILGFVVLHFFKRAIQIDSDDTFLDKSQNKDDKNIK